MESHERLDCILIGYNESPFKDYVSTLRLYGENSEAYRDLKGSFVTIDGEPVQFTELASRVFGQEMRSGEIPNLAAVYLSHYLIRRGYNADYINLFQYEKERLIELLKGNPRCVAITTTFYVVNFPVTEIVQFIRKHNPDVPVVVGGVLVSNHHNAYDRDFFFAALRDMEADIFVLESQGEQTLLNIVKTLREGADISAVNNICYLKDGEMHLNPRVTENNSLDEESVNWLTFKHKNLGKTIQTRTARSCAFKCAFCGYPERGGPLTLANMDTVAAELESIRGLGYVENVVFIDDTFNVPKARFKEFCNMLIEKQFNYNWFSYYRCDHGDDEAIDLMQKSGCKGVFLGIESGSQDILLKMNKRAQVENYVKGIKKLKEHGILTFASLITGYPGETESTVNETMDFLRETQPDYWRSQLWYCDPLTPVYKTKKEEFKIRGEGFKWEHITMDSMEAADYIEQMYLQTKCSVWLPSYSFDFWIIPYLMGKGISLPEFKKFMIGANKLLALEIASVEASEKEYHMKKYLQDLFDMAGKAGVKRDTLAPLEATP